MELLMDFEEAIKIAKNNPRSSVSRSAKGGFKVVLSDGEIIEKVIEESDVSGETSTNVIKTQGQLEKDDFGDIPF
jgi:coproporphyrinogen III oxidase